VSSKRFSLGWIQPKFHLVNWKTISSLISSGGLRVNNLMLFNKALQGTY
jgi:hypothetical protein